MQIITPRLVIRPLEERDTPALIQATDETWSDLSAWLRWATDRKRFTHDAYVRAYTQDCAINFRNQSDFVFAAFDARNDFILTIRLAPVRGQDGVYEFGGYWCRKKYQGNGYMTEALNAVSRVAFDVLQAQQLVIRHAAGHHKTRAVMDRIGFVETEILPHAHQLPNGSVVDEYVLTMTSASTLPPLDMYIQN